MKNNSKHKVLNEKGITLISLLVTVLIMMIIVGVAVSAGVESVDSTRLQGFYTQLEFIQKRVDDIASTNEGYYTNSDGTQTYVDIKTQGGSELTSAQSTFLQELLNNEEINVSASEFRYFTIDNLEKQLNLSQMEYNVFIHFDNRIIVAEDGIKINGKNYYILKNDIYFVEQNTNKNSGNISLNYNISKYGTNNYKIIVNPSTVGDLITNGTLRYKEVTTKYWETANGLEIVINKLAQYNIEYVDSNKNTVSQTITVSLDSENNPVVTVDE